MTVANAVLDGNELHVQSWTGFDVAQDIQRLRLISDALVTTHLEVLQSGGIPMPDVTLMGWETDPAIIAAVEALRESHAQVTFTDPNGTDHLVVVDTFTKQLKVPDPVKWSWTLVVIEVA